MIYKIVGIERFVSKAGKNITKIHSIYQGEKIAGVGCETFFILTENVPDTIAVDLKFTPYYGRQGANGFLAGINIVNE